MFDYMPGECEALGQGVIDSQELTGIQSLCCPVQNGAHCQCSINAGSGWGLPVGSLHLRSWLGEPLCSKGKTWVRRTQGAEVWPLGEVWTGCRDVGNSSPQPSAFHSLLLPRHQDLGLGEAEQWSIHAHLLSTYCVPGAASKS